MNTDKNIKTTQGQPDGYTLLGARALYEACPTDDFESGEPDGKCWGDGYYTCN